MNKKMELRIISNRPAIPGWLKHVLDATAGEVHATLSVVESHPGRRVPWALRCLCRVDRRLTGVLWKHRDAFVDRAFPGETATLQAAAATPCDIILNLTADEIAPSMATGSAYGIWRLATTGSGGIAHGDVLANFAYRDDPCYVAIVVQAGDTVGELARADVRASNVPIGGLLRQRCAWTAADLLTVMLRKLSRRSDAGRCDIRALLTELPAAAPEPSRCGVGLVLRYFLTAVSRGLAWGGKRFFAASRWHLAYARRRDGVALAEVAMSDFQTIPLPKGEFWADPFLMTREGVEYIFFERFSYRRKRGDIACIQRRGRDGAWSAPTIVLDTGFHLSYPFVFEDAGQVYMIPETRSAQQIRLYRAVDFPTQWVLDDVLLDKISAVDTTLYRHGGKYWLFSCVANIPDSENSSWLNLYCSDSLHGPWVAHPENPIDCSLGHARPAGGIFEDAGKLFRTGQNSYTYGRGIVILQLDEWDEKNYREHPVRVIEPDWNRELCGVHTLNFSENSAVIDLLTKYKPHKRKP